MTTGFGAMHVEITADATNFTAGMKNAEGQLASTQAKMNRVLAAMEKGFKSVAGGLKDVLGPVFSLKAAFASLIGSGGLGLLVKNAIDSADALVDMADRIGISTDALQELMYVASQSGLSVEQLETGLRKLNDNIAGAAAGQKGNILRQLGIDAGSIDNVRNLSDVLLDVADAFQKAGPQSAAGIKILTEAFGSKSGTAFATALKDGSEGVRTLIQDAQRLGLVLEADLLRGANSANDALDRMKQIVGTNLNRVLLNLAPSIERVAQAFADSAPLIREWADLVTKAVFGVQALSLQGLGRELKSINEALALEDERDRRFKGSNPFGINLRGDAVRNQLLQRKAEIEALIEIENERQRALGNMSGGGGAVPPGMKERPETAKMAEYLASLRESVQLAQAETEEREVLEATLRAEAIAREDNAKGLRATKELSEQEKEQIRAYVQLRQQANTADDRAKKLKEEGKQLFEQTRTPAEIYAATLQRINELLAANAISETTANRARTEAKKTFEESDEAAKRLNATADQLTMSFESAFTQAVQGGKNMQDIIAALIQDIVQMILKLFILKPLMDAIAQSMRSILSGGGGGGGGGGWLASLFGGGNSSGNLGFDGGAGGSWMNFATGGSFSVGGSGGTDSQLVAFRATPGEMVDVSTPGQAARRGEGNTTVIVNNKTDGKATAREELGPNLEKMIIVTVEREMRKPGSRLNRAHTETFGSKTQLATRG